MTTVPRARRSRDALITAMTTLLERSDALPTISDVVREAGASRPTFYHYFADLPALMHESAMTRLAVVFDEVRSSADLTHSYPRDSIHALLTALRAHADFFLRVLDGPAGYRLFNQMMAFIAGRVLTHPVLGPVVERHPAGSEQLARFLAAGCTAVAVQEIRAGRKPGVIADEIGAFLNLPAAAAPDITVSGAGAAATAEARATTAAEFASITAEEVTV